MHRSKAPDSSQISSELVERIFIAGHRIAAADNPDAVLVAVKDAITGPQPNSAYPSVDHCLLSYTPSSSTTLFKVAAVWDRQPEQAPKVGGAYTDLPDQALEAILSGKTLVLQDLSDIHAQGYTIVAPSQFSLTRLSSLLLVPLIAQRQLVGLIALGSFRENAFTPLEIRILQIMADEVALWVSNAIKTQWARPVRVDGQPSQADTITAADRMTLLAESAQAYLSLAADAVLITDPQQVILSANARAGNLFGYSQPELVGKQASVLIPPQRRSENESWARIALQQGIGLRGETECLTKDGRIFPAYVTLWPIKEGDTVIALVEMTLDVSKRQAQHTTLEGERDLLEAILEASNDAMLMVDSEFRVVSANLQFEAFFQLARFQILNQPVEALLERLRARPDLPAALTNLL